MRSGILYTLIVIPAFGLILNGVLASDIENLFSAAKQGDAEAILEQVDESTNIDSLNKGKATPLWIAVNWNRTQAVVTLLKLGANPNIKGYGATPLFRAIGRDTEIVKTLINHGADTNITTDKGNYSPLGRAAALKLSTFESLKSKGHYDGPFPNKLETARVLIEAGANVNHINSHRQSPLRNAIRVGNITVAKILLQNGADVHQVVDDTTSHGRQSGNTILMEAIFWFGIHQNMEMIELLLSNGANPNDTNTLRYDEHCASCEWSGYNALTYSTERGYHDVVRMLLSHGANPNVPRQDGKRALEIATENEDQKMIAILSAK